MADLSLDLRKGSVDYYDLLLLNGDLVLTNDSNPNGTDPVLQNILQNLRVFLGEWFLDNTIGMPYFQQILVKNPDQAAIDALFLNRILSTKGVVGVSEYSFEIDRVARVLRVGFVAQKTDGEINYSGTINTTAV